MWYVGLTVVGGYLFLVGLLFFIQEQFVYHPDSRLYRTPADFNMAFEPVKLQTPDDEEIFGWFVPHADSRGTLLYFHGNAGNIADRVESIAMLHSLRLDIFIVDYRGYGRSTGKPSERGTYTDALAAWEYLVTEKEIPPASIIVYGRSLGGAVAVYIASQNMPGALILGSTFTSIRAMARHQFPWIPIGPLLRINYDSLEKIAHIGCPLFLSHSKDDTIIPFEHGEALFERAREPKEFLVLRGDHNESIFLSRDEYKQHLDSFLREHLDE